MRVHTVDRTSFLFRVLSIQVGSWGWGRRHWLPFWDPRKFANPGGRQVTMLGYQYDLEFRSTQKHCNADGLSWLPQANRDGIRTSEPEATPLNVHHLTSLPLTACQPLPEIQSWAECWAMCHRVGPRRFRRHWRHSTEFSIGPQFTAKEFSECMQTNSITHLSIG